MSKGRDSYTPTHTSATSPTRSGRSVSGSDSHPMKTSVSEEKSSTETMMAEETSSRIIVKGLGKRTDENALRKLFSERGEVTDVRVMRRENGESRMFAFVGFRTEAQASEAVRYYDQTFLGLSRLSVSIAKRVADRQLEERKAKLAASKSQDKLKQLKERVKADEEAAEAYAAGKGKKFTPTSTESEKPGQKVSKHKSEFMELVTKRGEQKSWANDDVLTAKGIQEVSIEAENKQAKEAATAKEAAAAEAERLALLRNDSDDDDSDDEWQDLDSLVKGNSAVKKVSMASDSGDDEESDSEEKVPVKATSDLDFLRSKMTAFNDFSDDSDDDFVFGKNATANTVVANFEDTESEESASEEEEEDSMSVSEENEGEDQTTTVETAVEGGDDAEDELDETRIFVRNLPYTCTEDELRTLCSKFGPVIEVNIPLDAERKGRGFAYVTFQFPQHSAHTIDALNGSAFQGRLLKVSLSRVARALTADGVNADLANSKLSSYQLKKELERRKQSGVTTGWNAAFVRTDAVVDSLAAKYGVKEAEILDTGLAGGDLAVRMAIAETQVIAENKEYLAAHGVDLDAMESTNSQQKATERSTTTLLVKNLPPDTVPDELESMFTKFGGVAAFIMPPSKTLALVDFLEPSEARAAQRGLSYRRYKNSPLYLEWAPLGTVQREKAVAAAKKNSVAKSAAAQEAASKSAEAVIGTTDDNMEDFSTVFVKNLSFKTTEEGLKAHINRLGVIEGLRTVVIQKKYKGDVVLSQGFGFIEFRSAQFATDAIKRLNGSVLDSHTLECKPSDKRLTVAPTALASAELRGAGANKSGKLIVRNVAFQASQQEIRTLFSAFGSVKRVRIPKKMGGNHRGFAFVDFATAQEAANAMAALKNSHLYGRHLVITWAKEDDEDGETMLEESRKRANRDAENLAHLSKRARPGAVGETGDEDVGGFEDIM